MSSNFQMRANFRAFFQTFLPFWRAEAARAEKIFIFPEKIPPS